ncbi:hypothetical protein [Lapidilactobacillus luobeiensis]|uniref:hypothetical protein n=1 Tax=Lapidilactobacillus luobeiensis TaxID=2950371 RepID=UPI0021C3C030|nr:hypothetical protein [Lapidilactobacillus luobeiensis]
MEISTKAPLTILGQVALAHDISANGSYYNVWQDFEAEAALPRLDQELIAQQGTSNRVGLVVFAPDGYQYWTGVAVPATVATPQGWYRYQLPAGSAFDLVQESPQFLPQVPINYKLNQVYEAADQAAVKLPESLGHAELPFFLEQLTFSESLDAPQSQIYRIYDSPEIDAFEDDLD